MPYSRLRPGPKCSAISGAALSRSTGLCNLATTERLPCRVEAVALRFALGFALFLFIVAAVGISVAVMTEAFASLGAAHPTWNLTSTVALAPILHTRLTGHLPARAPCHPPYGGERDEAIQFMDMALEEPFGEPLEDASEAAVQWLTEVEEWTRKVEELGVVKRVYFSYGDVG
jgi:hypothetical protein